MSTLFISFQMSLSFTSDLKNKNFQDQNGPCCS